MVRAKLIALAAILLLGGCTTGTDEVDLSNPVDPGAEGSLPAPESVQATLGDNLVQLSWTMPGDIETPPARFAVFRREVDEPEDDVRMVAEVAEPQYTDRRVRNGNGYLYRVAAAPDQGAFGKRSEEILAVPALFSIVIENDAAFTRNRSVVVTLTAPAGTDAVQISEDPGFAGAGFRRFAASLSVDLSFGDREKTLHARFRTRDGAETLPVSDSILLDTRALIQSVTFSGSAVRSPGETIHFRLEAGEAEGAATVDVGGLFSALTLFDDGSSGDLDEGDGVYERDVDVPAGTLVTRATVTGRFTDRAGNRADAVLGARTLTVEEAPDPVELSEAVLSQPPDPAAVTLRWSRSTVTDFESYRLFRSGSADVNAGDDLAASTTNAGTLELSDGDVVEGLTYYYRVYVRTRSGLEAGSNPRRVDVPNLRPPARVNLNAPDGISETAVGLSWNRTTERDFAAYRVYRSLNGAVDESDLLIATVIDPDTTLHFDTNLRENTEYFYRLYVVDTGGLRTPSSERSARTRNLPPPGVVMSTASDIDTMGVTLSWGESDVHDFDAYRLYRDFGPGVGSFSTLVAEITERDVTSYRDTGLDSGTTYYYRVFVVDDGELPGPEATGSSNTIRITTDTP